MKTAEEWAKKLSTMHGSAMFTYKEKLDESCKFVYAIRNEAREDERRKVVEEIRRRITVAPKDNRPWNYHVRRILDDILEDDHDTTALREMKP